MKSQLQYVACYLFQLTSSSMECSRSTWSSVTQCGDWVLLSSSTHYSLSCILGATYIVEGHLLCRRIEWICLDVPGILSFGIHCLGASRSALRNNDFGLQFASNQYYDLLQSYPTIEHTCTLVPMRALPQALHEVSFKLLLLKQL